MAQFRFRHLIVVCLLALALAWISLAWYMKGPSLTSAEDFTQQLVLNIASIERDVRALTSLEPNRNYGNEDAMLKAEELITARFKELGYEVRRQDVRGNGDKIFHNLIVRYGDRNSQDLIVVGAHYDVAGEPNPGADDNASGVAGILELARLLQTYKPSLPVPIEMVIYTLEEPPFFTAREMGSIVHARALKKEGLNVRLMISLKMIGAYSDEFFTQKYPSPILYAIYPWTGNFISVITRPETRTLNKQFARLMSANCKVPLELLIAPPKFIHGSDYSAHRSYWAEDWPALMITDTAFYRYEHYHRPSDTPDKLNFPNIGQVIRGLYAAITSPDLHR